MKKSLVLIMAAILLMVSASGCSFEKDEPAAINIDGVKDISGEIPFFTGAESDACYYFGGVISTAVSMAGDIDLLSEESGDSVYNCKQLAAAGKPSMALVRSDVLDQFYYGRGAFEGSSPASEVRAVAALFPEALHIVVKADGIDSVEELKGKTVFVGNDSYTDKRIVEDILEVYNLDFSDITPVYGNVYEYIEDFVNGKIDAVFICDSVPSTAVYQMAAGADISLISLKNEDLEELIEEHPFYTSFTIESGIYSFSDENVIVPALSCVLACDYDLDEDACWAITKIIFEAKSYIEGVNAKGRFLDLDYAVQGISIPFHRGAKQYYYSKEVLDVWEENDAD